jgi:hypothetical protein
MRHAALWLLSYVVMIAIGLVIWETVRIGSHVHGAAGWVISIALLAVAVALWVGDWARKRRAARRGQPPTGE